MSELHRCNSHSFFFFQWQSLAPCTLSSNPTAVFPSWFGNVSKVIYFLFLDCFGIPPWKGGKTLQSFLWPQKAETSVAAAGSCGPSPWPLVGREEDTLGYPWLGEGTSRAVVPGVLWPEERVTPWQRRSARPKMLPESFFRRKNVILLLGKYSCLAKRVTGSDGLSCSCFKWRWGESHCCRPTIFVPNSTFPSQQSWQEAARPSPCAWRPLVSARAGQVQGKPRGAPGREPFTCPWTLVLATATRLGGGWLREAARG